MRRLPLADYWNLLFHIRPRDVVARQTSYITPFIHRLSSHTITYDKTYAR